MKSSRNPFRGICLLLAPLSRVCQNEHPLLGITLSSEVVSDESDDSDIIPCIPVTKVWGMLLGPAVACIALGPKEATPLEV